MKASKHRAGGASKKPESWIERNYNSISYAIVASSALLYSILNAQYNTGVYNDDAVYVLGARDLAHNAPFHSLILKPDYPLPGLPLLLAPLARFIKTEWINLEWVTVVVSVLLVFLIGKLVRKWLTAGESLAVVTLFAFNPVVCTLSGIIMPTPYYTLAVIASFLLINELIKKPNTWGALALGFIAGWGSVIRPEGFVLVICCVGVLALTRPGRDILRLAILPIAFWVLFLVYWFRVRHYAATEYGGDVAALASYWSHHAASGALFSRDFFRVFLVKGLTGYSMRTQPALVVLLLIALSLTVTGAGFRSLWKQQRIHHSELYAITLFCGLYGMVHFFWHAVVSRYAIVLLPFVLLLAVRGLNEILSSLKHRRIMSAIALTLILVSYASKNSHAVYESLYEPNPMHSPPWRTLAWLNQNIPPQVKLLSDIAPSIELYTNRPALTFATGANFEKLLYHLKQANIAYVVDRRLTFITPGVEGTDNPNVDWVSQMRPVSAYPQRFELVFNDPAEQTTVYRIVYETGFAESYEKYQVATQYYLEGHEDQAFRLLHEVLNIDPQLGDATNLLGGIYMRQGHFKYAESAFLRAIELLPDSPAAMVNLASIYRLEGQTTRSDSYIQQALQAGALNGDQEQLKARIEALQHLWDQHQAIVFMDPP